MKYVYILLALLLLLPLTTAHISVQPTNIDFEEPGDEQVVQVQLTRTVTNAQAFLNENGSWQPFTLTSQQQINEWHLGTTSAQITIREERIRSTQEVRIATYSCTWNDKWACPDDWEITIIPTTPAPQTDPDPEPNPDLETLASLYQATNGDKWTNNQGWLEEENLADWYGIETNQEGRVTRIDLSNNNLQGELPSILAQLTHLKELDLSNNNLQGTLPTQITNLQLDTYNVNNNQYLFTNLIPTIQENPPSFTYQEQQRIGTTSTTTRKEGESFSRNVNELTHEQNQYQWYKNGQAINGETNKALHLTSLSTSDAGEYELRTTNPQAPGLEIRTNPTTLQVTPTPEEPLDLSDEILPNSQLVATEHGNIYRAQIVGGISRGWGFTFLPDQRILLTEKAGNVRIVTLDGDISVPLSAQNTPVVHDERQGGLLDIALHPDFENNNWVYMTYAGIEVQEGEDRYMTHLARARFVNDDLQDLEVLFRGQNPTADTNPRHYGSRITFDHEGYLYMTIGDRRRASWAQNTLNHAGTVIRLHDDGSIPSDNPFIGNSDYLPEIYSYGHRNSQGLTTHPWTGEIWENMHGPQGGDEINVIFAGANYGWPLYTTGVDYGGGTIGYDEPPEGTIPPVHNWTPSIAPSGITFYTGNKLPAWRGNLLNGALTKQDRGRRISRLEINGHEIVHEEHILNEFNQRIRDVRQGPDEYIYYLTDGGNGRIYRLGPFEQ